MDVLKRGIKKDPYRRRALPDRIFFGYGACHIRAGACLDRPPLAGFRAERIIPADGFYGNHIYVTDGVVAFDFHGYSGRERLFIHHRNAWSGSHPGWDCTVEQVDFHLLDTCALNQRKMLGPDQYLHDATARAHHFIARVDRDKGARKARSTTST